MPLGPPLKPFDLGKAWDTGTRNALADIAYQQNAQQLRDYPENRRNALAQMQIDRAIQGFKFLEQNSRLVGDQASYESFKTRAEELGISHPGELPSDYDPELIKRLSGYAQKNLEQFGAFEQIPNMPEGTYGQKNLTSNKYTNIKTEKDIKGSGGGGAGVGGLKAADENAIYKYSASQFGLYDPVTGQFKGLKGTDKQDAQAIATLASRLYSQGGKTRHESVTEAARMMGIKIRDLKKEGASGKPSQDTNVFDELPDPANYKSRSIRDTVTGKRYVSDGTNWVEIK